MKRMRSLLAAAIGLALPFASPAVAQDYPTKPVRIVVPFAPGGINDVAARLLAQHLSEKLGKQFIAENRPGGGGISATEHVIGSPADGYTILILSIANAVHPAMYKLKYDLLKSIDPVAMVVTSPNTLAVHPRLAGQDREGVHRARQGEAGRHPVRLRRHRRLAASRHGELQGRHQHRPAACALQGRRPGRHRRGGRQHQGDHVDAVERLDPPQERQAARPRGLRAEARRSASRTFPTFTEAGVPEYEGGNWIGIGVPAGTPKAVIDLLAQGGRGGPGTSPKCRSR